MRGSARNTPREYASDWLTLLVSMRVATEEAARAAMSGFAQKAIDEMEERRRPRAQIGQLRRREME